MTVRLASLLGAAALAFAVPAAAQDNSPPASATTDDKAWIEKSNTYTTALIEAQAAFSPEGASGAGLEQFDGLAMDLGPNLPDRMVAMLESQVTRLTAAKASEGDPRVKQDLQILIDDLIHSIEGVRLNQKTQLAWTDVPATVFGVMNGVLDDQRSPARRQKALELLQRYTGLYKGTTPLTELAKARWAESQRQGKIGPFKGRVEDTLGKTDVYISGVRELFAKYKIKGADKALDAMETQLRDYAEWERANVLPAAREDFRLPPELYAYQLKGYGIDIAPEELISRARRGFYEIRQQMRALAPQIAAKNGWSETDYPSVLNKLREQQIPPERMEARYAEILGEIQQIAARERIATLPSYPVAMRLGTEAENAASPAPHMRPPRLIGNTGEQGVFVLTTGQTKDNPIEAHDFDFDAAAWTLSVHEGRPGHELQFARMVETGVSQARALYAANSANAEGWALYAEAEMQPYEPLEGQLIALQHRLLRASRAMLDPMLNLGQADRETAERILREEAGFSPAMVKQEADRYTFRAPGQAGSYYYGYSRLLDIRMQAEVALGAKFDRMAFNDFILAQGLLTLNGLEDAVKTQFIPAMAAR
ncbi:DUF885 domain-containing protein [Tsuneonella sp. HG222]